MNPFWIEICVELNFGFSELLVELGNWEISGWKWFMIVWLVFGWVKWEYS